MISADKAAKVANKVSEKLSADLEKREIAHVLKLAQKAVSVAMRKGFRSTEVKNYRLSQESVNNAVLEKLRVLRYTADTNVVPGSPGVPDVYTLRIYWW